MTPESDAPRLVPRPHQAEAIRAILAARAEERPGFLLGDMTGLGKTLSVWGAIAAMPERAVLIVCPKGAMPQWRRTIRDSRLADKDVTLLNYERTKSLLALPAASGRRSVRAKNNELAKLGRPKRVWPLVVFDEAHRLRNPTSQQGQACRRMAEAAAFTVYASATAGQAPHELSYLGALLGHAVGRPVETTADFRALMQHLKIGRAKGRWQNWSWEPNARDQETMAGLLYRGPDAIGLRRRPADIAGWPEVQRDLAPTALDAPPSASTTRPGASSAANGASPAARTARRRWAADLRFRQKASLIRVAGTVDLAEDLLQAGEQVAVSVAFLETGAALVEAFTGRGWRAGAIDGTRTAEANEAVRVAFQRGELDAVVFTVTESISLHRNELPGGERPRSLIVHDMRHSAIQLSQIEGRCHRDGERAAILFAYAEGTVEERVAATVIARMAGMDRMAGEDTSLLDAIGRIIDGEAG